MDFLRQSISNKAKILVLDQGGNAFSTSNNLFLFLRYGLQFVVSCLLNEINYLPKQGTESNLHNYCK